MRNSIVESAFFQRNATKSSPSRRRIALFCFVVLTAFWGTFVERVDAVFSQEPSPQTAREPSQKSQRETRENLTTVETKNGAVVARVSTEPKKTTSLSPIVLSVALEKPKSLRLAANDVDGLYGDFDVAVLDEKEETPRELDAARDVVVRRWTLYPKRRGTLVLPPIPLKLSDVSAPSETEKSQDDASNAQESRDVSLTLPEREFEIPTTDAPSIPFETIAPDWSPIRRFPTRLVLLSALATALVVGGIVALRRRFRRVSVASALSFEKFETPSETALRRLDELKTSRLYLENDAEFYPTVSAILRRYLAEEFGLNAEEKTTQEVSALLAVSTGNARREADKDEATAEERAKVERDVLTTPEIRRDVERSLSAVDLVKFARRSTTVDDAREIFEATRRAVAAASEKLAVALRRLDEERRAALTDDNHPQPISSDSDADR